MHGFDAAFGGARRDEEKSRAKERIFSFRGTNHAWDPKNQRPELWRLYNTRVNDGEIDARLPDLELDRARHLGLHPARGHPDRAALLRGRAASRGPGRPAHHGRRRANAPPDGEAPVPRLVRFRTLGCYPLTGAVESDAATLEAIVAEMIAARTSERGGRLIDQESAASMERKKREGYF